MEIHIGTTVLEKHLQYQQNYICTIFWLISQHLEFTLKICLKQFKYICRKLLISVLFVIAKYGKQSKCPYIGKWLNKLCYTHTQYYVLIFCKINNKEDFHELIWSDLQDILLIEKAKCRTVSIISVIHLLCKKGEIRKYTHWLIYGERKKEKKLGTDQKLMKLLTEAIVENMRIWE